MDETFAERRARQERELNRAMDRQMIPIVLPMDIAAGAMAGMLFHMLLFPPLPNAFIGLFMLTCLALGAAPIIFMMIKYR